MDSVDFTRLLAYRVTLIHECKVVSLLMLSN